MRRTVSPDIKECGIYLQRCYKEQYVSPSNVALSGNQAIDGDKKCQTVESGETCHTLLKYQS